MAALGSRLCARALYAAVGLSGCAALMYQVAWTRRLASVTSATTTAQAVVLAVMMAGLGLGAWLAGRKARALRAPGTAYAGVEVVAAFAACVSIPLFGASEAVRTAVAGAGGGLRLGLSVQLGALALFLALPATALGASLPLLVEALDRNAVRRDAKRAAARIATLYGANTFGALIGCGVAGFASVESLGLERTTWWGAALAATAAAIALAATRGLPRVGVAPEAAGRRPPRAGAWSDPTVAFASVAGFVGLAAEVVWTRMVALVIPNTTYVFTQVLACVLFGVALGAWAVVPVLRWARSASDPGAALNQVIAVASALGALLLCAVPTAISVFSRSPALQDRIAAGSSLAGLLWLGALLVPGAAATAAILPASVALRRAERGAAESFGVLYAANTAGCVTGSAAAAFVLLPLLGSTGATLLLSGLLGIVGLAALHGRDRRSGSARPVMAGSAGARPLVALAAVAAACVALAGFADFPRSIYAARLEPGERILEFREGRDSDVMVTETASGRRRLWINSVWVAGTGGGHRGLGHLPALFVDSPRSALGIALGTGQTFAAAHRHGFETLDCVEIDAGVIALSRRWFAEAADHLFARDGVRLHHDDGRAFLRTTRERFDLIVLEPLQAWTVGTSNLYTVEFYREAEAALAKGGVVAQWIPFYGQGVDETRALVRAALEVFPQASLWLDDRDGILLLRREPFALRPERLRARIRARGIAADLERNALGNLEDLLSLFVLGPDGLAAWTRGAPLLRDDRPFLEFAAARQVGVDHYREILASVRDELEPPHAYLAEASPNANAEVRAAVEIRDALIRERLLTPEEHAARAGVLEGGLATAPSSLLRRRYRNLMLGWGRGAQQRGELGRAEQIYRRALQHAPETGEVAVNLALLLAGQARQDDARRVLDRPFEQGPVADSARRVLGRLDADLGPSGGARR